MTIWKKVLILVLVSIAGCAGSSGFVTPLPNEWVVELPLLQKIYPPLDVAESRRSRQYGWEIAIWKTNRGDECLYQNFDPICAQTSLYVIVSDGLLGGETFGFRTQRAFAWEVSSIEPRSGNPKCAILRLRERVPDSKSVGKWTFMTREICVSPSGIETGNTEVGVSTEAGVRSS